MKRCGHCKAAKPEYAAASKETSVPMVAVDCTSSGSSICDDQDVSGYPTIKFFDLDADVVIEDYQSARVKSAFVKYLKKKDPNYVPPPLDSIVDPWNGESGRVQHLSDDHFDAFREKNSRFLLMAHAPWCVRRLYKRSCTELLSFFVSLFLLSSFIILYVHTINNTGTLQGCETRFCGSIQTFSQADVSFCRY